MQSPDCGTEQGIAYEIGIIYLYSVFSDLCCCFVEYVGEPLGWKLEKSSSSQSSFGDDDVNHWLWLWQSSGDNVHDRDGDGGDMWVTMLHK